MKIEGVKETCVWKECWAFYYDDDTVWECSACDVMWTVRDGNPKEEEIFYCPKCGRFIEEYVKLAESEGEEEDES